MERKDEKKTAEKKLQFAYLPGFARFLLDEKLDELCRASLALSREVNYPLLKYFSHLPEEQLLELSKKGSIDFYTHAVNNTLAEQLHHALDQWKQNQLPLISKDQVVAEDIALAGFVRRKIWRSFLPQYTKDIDLAFKILSEIDEYQMEADSASFQIFIDAQLMKMEQINKVLLHNENLYKQAQELTHSGNWSWTPEDGKMQWSDELYRIYGLEPQSEQMTIERFASFIHPDDREKRIGQMHRSLETLDPPSYIMRIVRPDGTVAVISGKSEVIVSAMGTPYKMLGTCQDITNEYTLSRTLEQRNKELQDLNLSLEYKNRELERSNRELSAFSYIASHDLQEPLRKIRTYSNMILDREYGSLPDMTKKHLDSINASANRMQQLIKDLLTFSHTHTYTVEMENVDLNAIIREIAAHYDELLREKQLMLKIGDLPSIKGIPFQLVQLFENIISNAIKYRKPEVIPEIIITVDLMDGRNLPTPEKDTKRKYYKININDNGIGFEPQYGEKIFEIFQRLHGRDEYSGTGIGLAICKKIVQNHEGFISATGTPGVGATFTVFLPQSLN